MTGGYADSITLCWFDGGLNGSWLALATDKDIIVIMILVVSFIFSPV
jgi:hypothetical protein